MPKTIEAMADILQWTVIGMGVLSASVVLGLFWNFKFKD
jgi:hypothetical protein